MKCPICGLDFRGNCIHTFVDLINEFNLELNRHMVQTKKDKKEIGQLQDELSVSEMSLSQCELRRKQEEKEIERLKKELQESIQRELSIEKMLGIVDMKIKRVLEYIKANYTQYFLREIVEILEVKS